MKLVKSKNCNVNYLAKVVDIKVFRKHSNPEVTKLKCCTIDGFNIITSIDAEPGLYIYFPTACCINPDFLSYNNLFRKSEKNNDPHKTGLFEDNGRLFPLQGKGLQVRVLLGPPESRRTYKTKSLQELTLCLLL